MPRTRVQSNDRRPAAKKSPKKKASKPRAAKKRTSKPRAAKRSAAPDNVRVTKDGWTIVDSNESLALVVTEEHVRAAKCGDSAKCVIAQALHAHFGHMADGFEIGSRISKVYSEAAKRLVRYGTSAALSRSLRVFDETGEWRLPPGTYYLRPMPKTYRLGARWHEKREPEDGRPPGVQSVFKGTAKAPTRYARTVRQLAI